MRDNSKRKADQRAADVAIGKRIERERLNSDAGWTENGFVRMPTTLVKLEVQKAILGWWWIVEIYDGSDGPGVKQIGCRFADTADEAKAAAEKAWLEWRKQRGE